MQSEPSVMQMMSGGSPSLKKERTSCGSWNSVGGLVASSVTKGDMNFNEGIGLGSGFWEGVSGGEQRIRVRANLL